eukprot:TRINITY_DN12080_c4_g1_i1.p1 TRINITY_DN12080_c4_g1~~TRINITY_DN12080_c4_g1_i1.p1  ORF type:complete len:462 (+),score=124.97 TRINITY_DN12080_c4_g1_i1:50-1387(+)
MPRLAKRPRPRRRRRRREAEEAEESVSDTATAPRTPQRQQSAAKHSSPRRSAERRPRVLPPLAPRTVDTVLEEMAAYCSELESVKPKSTVRMRCKRKWDFTTTLPQALHARHADAAANDVSLPALPPVVVVCPRPKRGGGMRSLQRSANRHLGSSVHNSSVARSARQSTRAARSVTVSADPLTPTLLGQCGETVELFGCESDRETANLASSVVRRKGSTSTKKPKLRGALNRLFQANQVTLDEHNREKYVAKFPFTRDEYTRLRECFEAIDEDGNGELDWGEIQELGSLTGFRMDRSTFDRMDRDGSGTIDFVEMLRGFYPQCPIRDVNWAVRNWGMPREDAPADIEDGDVAWQDDFETEDAQEIAEIFAVFNKAGGHGITFSELRSQLDNHYFSDEHLHQIFEEFDTNGDGMLSISAFARLLAESYQKRRRGSMSLARALSMAE